MAPWVESLLDSGRTLYDAARACPVRRCLGGRRSALRIPLEDDLVVVRHYWRGGLPRRFTRDRYLDIPLAPRRPLAELRTSEAARRAGIATPEVLAAVTYVRGAFYRGDLVTRYVPRTRPLSQQLLARDGQMDPEAAHALRALLESLARGGLRHPDLHGDNILLQEIPEPPGLRAWIVDLDRCRMRPGFSMWGLGGGAGAVSPLPRRLRRSLADAVPDVPG